MGKKKKKFGVKDKKEPRGYRVVSKDGRPILFPAYTEGIPQVEAERMARQYAEGHVLELESGNIYRP